MDFVAQLNENVLLLTLILGVTLAIGMAIGVKLGGWNRHLVFFWTLAIYTIYLLITPAYYYSVGKETIVGTDISRYYGLGFFFNIIAVLSFIIGYRIKGPANDKKWNAPAEKTLVNPHKKIAILFYALFGVVLINLAVGGTNIQQVFVGNEVIGMGASGGSYFLQNFTDSLICVFILAYLYGTPWRYLIAWIFISFFLFSLLGFRYRIVLTLFGILFVYLYKNKITAARMATGLLLGMIFFYGVMFSTENRRELIFRDYGSMTYDPLQFDYERFFEQTRGSLADMAVYRLYDNPNKVTEYDYGLTMFGYVFIRMIPRAIYPDKDRFYPPPQLAITIRAYDAWWAKFSGEATLSVSSLYIALGWLGVVLGHFFWGLLLRVYSDSVRRSDHLSIASFVVIALVSFQWITRGYFPQIIDQAAYMFIPIWILRYLSIKRTSHEGDSPG